MRLILVLMIAIIASCKVGPASPTSADPVSVKDPAVAPTEPINPIATPTPIPTPTATPGPHIVDITVYALARTEAPVNGWPTKIYTAIGYCTQYLSQVYCWDDGLKTLIWVFNNFTYGPYTYSYWGAYTGGFHCHGGCPDDAMTAPIALDISYVTNLTQTAINLVLSTGIATTMTCTEINGNLNCGSFTLEVVP